MTPTVRRRAALVAAFGLLLALLASAPARAVAPDVVEGTVAIPSDATDVDFEVQLYTLLPGGAPKPVRTEPVFQGAFVAAALPDDVTFRVELRSSHPEYVSGFWAGPGKPLVGNPQDGIPVVAGGEPVHLTPARGVELRGTVTVPEGFDWDAGPLHAYALELSSSSISFFPDYNRIVEVDQNGVVTFASVRPQGTFVLAFADDARLPTEPERFEAGFWNAASPGLVETYYLATPVRPGTSFRAAITTHHVAPVLAPLDAPTLTGAVKVGATLTASPGRWSMPWLEHSFQWLRDGKVIAGATGASYRLRATEAGSQVAVRVTARSSVSGRSASVTSHAVTVPVLAAPQVTKPVRVTGTVRLGHKVKASPVRWDVSGTRTTYQWLRSGKAIKGATSSSYRLTRADVGKKISVRVTGTALGHRTATATSRATKVKKAKTKVTAKLNRARSKVTVRIKAKGLEKPRGTVKVKVGTKTVRATLKAKHRGKVTVRVPRLAKGRYKVSASFRPTTAHTRYLTTGKAKKLTLRVR